MGDVDAASWLSDVRASDLHSRHAAQVDTDWYRLGDGFLGLRSAHRAFAIRFAQLFGGCREQPPADTSLPRIECEIEPPGRGPWHLIRCIDSVPLDVVEFSLTVFGDRGCRECEAGTFPGRAMTLTENDAAVVLGCAGDTLVAHQDQRWEWLVGNLAVHRLFRRQTKVAMLHAGSAAIGDRGVLIVGPKGSGKTTLSLALAARGHGFLGDEIAALRLDTNELLPLRRSTSIRSGLRAAAVEAALLTAGLPAERFPDGTTRVRAGIDRLFPRNTARAVPLSAIVFLRAMGALPRLEPFAPEREHLGWLTPLRSSLWMMPPAERAFRLLGILPQARCYSLLAGDPDATAELLESAVGES